MYHFQVLGLHVLDDLWEQGADILSHSHVGDDSLDSILAAVAVLAVQVHQQLGVFTYAIASESKVSMKCCYCVCMTHGGWSVKVPFVLVAKNFGLKLSMACVFYVNDGK